MVAVARRRRDALSRTKRCSSRHSTSPACPGNSTLCLPTSELSGTGEVESGVVDSVVERVEEVPFVGEVVKGADSFKDPLVAWS